MKLLFLLFAFLLTSQPASSTAAPTAMSVGIPCHGKGWYARNLWDMTWFDNRLFVGCGNSSNEAPSANAGPVAIWTYRIGPGWRSEFTVDEEQIDRFVVLDGVLTIPGADPREGWDFGNWYTRAPLGIWTKHRNIPNAIHTLDLIDFGGLRFAAIVPRNIQTSKALAISRDNGASWTTRLIPPNANLNYQSCALDRVAPVIYSYGFFTLNGELYSNTPTFDTSCPTSTKRAVTPSGKFALRWNGTDFVVDDLNLFNGLPNVDQMARPTVYGDKTVYIAAETVNGTKWKPAALMAIDASKQPQTLTPPNCSRPQDIDTFGSALIVLCNQPSGDQWTVSIEATCDLATWNTVASFTAPTFARSFALSSAPTLIYVGLGADTDAPSAAQAAVGEVFAIPATPPAC